MTFADVGDVLHLAPADSLSLALTGPMAPLISANASENLVLKAARLLEEVTDIKAACRITLEKHLPVGAGLGGGSSDAAAALKAINALCGMGLSSLELEALGLKLGADVPVCLRAETSVVRGVGEMLAPFRMPPLDAVLVHPGVGLATAQVYRAYKGEHSSPLPHLPAVDSAEAFISWLKETQNALEAPALSLLPHICDVLEALRQAAGCKFARMSGSGSSCFGIFPDATAAKKAADAIAQKKPAWWAVPTRLGNR